MYSNYCFFISKLTLASAKSSNLGLKKYRIPLSAPSRVSDLISSTNIIMNGKVAVKYLTFADDFMLFHIPKYISTHAHIRQATNSHRRISKSSIPLPICSTFRLKFY